MDVYPRLHRRHILIIITTNTNATIGGAYYVHMSLSSSLSCSDIIIDTAKYYHIQEACSTHDKCAMVQMEMMSSPPHRRATRGNTENDDHSSCPHR